MTRHVLLCALLACTPAPTPAPSPTPLPSSGNVPLPPPLPRTAPPASHASPGCSKATLASGPSRVSVSGAERTFTLVLPERSEGPSPLVFVLHGDGGSGAGIRKQMDLERVAGGRAVFVYPDSPGGWDLDGNRDVLFFDAMLFSISNGACIALDRVFVTGFSNGAYMANQLACRRGDRIRAVATHAGGGPYEVQGRYDAQGHLLCAGKAVASLVVHGLSDREVAPSEGDKSVAHWTFANRCGSQPSPVPPAPCVAYDCEQPVHACKIQGLGHGLWAEGAKVTWSFFEALK